MKTLRFLFTMTVACLFFAADADAQRGGRGGGDRGDRGGRPEMGGGDRGGRPSFGGDTGGRPTGGRPSFGGDTGGRPSFGGGRPSMGGAEGGRRGGGDPMSRMDSNGDGRIDQSEIEKIPSFVRESMKSRGIEIKPGSLDDVRNNMRTQFERVREEGGWGRPSSTESSSTYGNRQKYAPATSFRPRDKERLTTDLPEDYVPVDANADGQVALHEWILTRRSELSLFEQIDGNKDGVLTPVELVSFENKKDDEEDAEKWVRDRLVIVGPGGSSGGRTATGRTVAGKSDRKEEKRDVKDDKQKHEQFAAYAFKSMDRNRNGKIDQEEWDSSRRVRPMFEKAGYKLTAMGSDEFSKRYVKAAMSDKK